MLRLRDIGSLSESCASVDLAIRYEFNRALALGRIITLCKEDSNRRGSSVFGPVGGPRKLVLAGVSAADERQPVRDRLFS